jgi:hypothetical protein
LHLEKLNIISDFFKNKMKRLKNKNKTKVICHTTDGTCEFTVKRSPKEITLKNFKNLFSNESNNEIKDYYGKNFDDALG